MLSLGANYAQLHLQQEKCKQKMKRKKEGQKAKENKESSEGRIYPCSPTEEAKAEQT